MPDQGQHRADQHRGLGGGQGDAPVDPEIAAAVDFSGLLQRFGEPQEKLAEQEDEHPAPQAEAKEQRHQQGQVGCGRQ